jgi:hypothetical protein
MFIGKCISNTVGLSPLSKAVLKPSTLIFRRSASQLKSKTKPAMVKHLETSKMNPALIESDTLENPMSPTKRLRTSHSTAAMALLSFREPSKTCAETALTRLSKVHTSKRGQDSSSDARSYSVTDDEEDNFRCKHVASKRVCLDTRAPSIDLAFKQPSRLFKSTRAKALLSVSPLPTGKPLSPAPLLPKFLASENLRPISLSF